MANVTRRRRVDFFMRQGGVERSRLGAAATTFHGALPHLGGEHYSPPPLNLKFAFIRAHWRPFALKKPLMFPFSTRMAANEAPC